MNINTLFPINSRSYGVVGINLLKSLVKLGHTPALFPLPSEKDIEAATEDHPLIRECWDRRLSYDYRAPSINLWHDSDLAKSVGFGKKCAFTIFELHNRKQNEIHQLLAQNLVIVPSKWAVNVIKESLGHVNSPKVIDVPLGYDPTIFFPREVKRKNNNTVFANFGKWELRKGHDILAEIFNKAFTKKDNVELWMSNTNPFCTPVQKSEWERLYTNSDLGEKITLVPWVATQNELANVMAQTDCGVFPSRAEGWGLETLEMMAMSKEVIVTNNTAHTEYCKSHNSYLIETPNLEVANDSVWFHGQNPSDGMWYSIGDTEIDQAVEFMRMVHRDKQEGRLRDQDKDVSHLTWENSAKRLVEAIQ